MEAALLTTYLSVFPSDISPIDEMQRPGLAMLNASPGIVNLYVSFGSFCDVLPYSGYLAGLSYNYGDEQLLTGRRQQLGVRYGRRRD